MSSPSPSPLAALRVWLAPPLGWLVAPLALFTLALVWRLWPEWSHNPDLSHGFFVPILVGLLLWEGARNGTQRWLPHGRWTAAAVIACVVGALFLFIMAGLLAATVGWGHALVLFVLSAAVMLCWLGALLALSSDRVKRLPFNWTTLTAVGLWLLAAPIPDGTYRRITLSLQHAITSGVLHSLHLLGIPARQMGNIIELATTSVGVEEACSGIRSLVSCLCAGFFFAAWLLHGAHRRVFLILFAPLLAVVMNFGRSLTLTLLANAGIDIGGFWHDATGFAVLGLTAAALAIIANALETPFVPVRAPTIDARAMPRTPFLGFAGVSLLAVGLAVFFSSFHRAPSGVATTPHSQIAKLIPENFEGWRAYTPQDLYRFTAQLQTQQLAERTFFRETPDGPLQITLYVAHWEAGQASVSMVASHTPDACWPGNGWDAGPVTAPQIALELDGRRYPVAEHRFFTHGTTPQHVWFWHIYNDRVINYRDPYSVRALLEIAWHFGFRREGSQYFVRLSSNQPWEKIAREPLVRELFTRLAPTGLAP